MRTDRCFNSLQTGKCIQSEKMGKIVEVNTVSIPFKRESVFRVSIPKLLESDEDVSIPFKRESVFRGASDRSSLIFEVIEGFNSLQTGKCIQRLERQGLRWKDHEFQFPSNGKVYSEQHHSRNNRRTRQVSIPFKRESVFRVFNNF